MKNHGNYKGTVFQKLLCLYAFGKSPEQQCYLPQNTERGVCFKAGCNKALIKQKYEK